MVFRCFIYAVICVTVKKENQRYTQFGLMTDFGKTPALLTADKYI